MDRIREIYHIDGENEDEFEERRNGDVINAQFFWENAIIIS